jgi:hypothetical protein
MEAGTAASVPASTRITPRRTRPPSVPAACAPLTHLHGALHALHCALSFGNYHMAYGFDAGSRSSPLVLLLTESASGASPPPHSPRVLGTPRKPRCTATPQ